jgi:hypothetical protein
MVFHFPLSLHKMTVEERNRLDEHLQSLKTETKIASGDFNSDSDEFTPLDIDEINMLLRRYTAIIFGNIMDSKGRTKSITDGRKHGLDINLTDAEMASYSPIMQMLMDDLAPFVYSMKPLVGTCHYRQMSKYNNIIYSPLGEGFVTLIGSFLANVTELANNSNVDIVVKNNIAVHGVILLNTLHSWIHQEIHLIMDTVSYVHSKTEAATKDDIVAKSRKKKSDKHVITLEKIAKRFKELRDEKPEISYDAASREIAGKNDILLSPRVIAKHLSKM